MKPPYNPLEQDAQSSFGQDFQRHRWLLLTVTLAALAVHLIMGYAWPLFAVRSVGTATISYYVNLVFFDKPVDYHLIAYREPLAPLFHGVTMSIGPTVNVAAQTVLAVSAVVFVFLITIPWGRFPALVASLLYLVDLPVQLQFHAINTEGLATWFLIVTLVLLRYALQRPNGKLWALFGFAVGLSGLTRPANLAFIVLGAGLVLVKYRPVQKLKWMGIAVGVMLLTILPWIVFKGVHYNLWAFSHEITDPFYRLAYDAGLIEPGNGPASQRLADLIQQHLLTQPQYADNGITLNQFLRLDQDSAANRNVYASNPFNQDVTNIVDQYEGWDSEYSLLRRAAIEAFTANPSGYVNAYLNSIDDVAFSRQDIAPFMASTFDMFVRRPDQMPPIYRESISHPNDVPDPSDESLQARAEKVLKLMAPLKAVQRHPEVASVIISVWEFVWPPLAIVYVFALIGLIWNRRVSLAYLLLANLGAIGLCLLSALLGNLERYREPVEVVFIITASVGLAGLIEALAPLFKRPSVSASKS